MNHTDSILWKLFYVTGCLFVAMQNMEEWEEAVFDKTKNLIELKSFSLYALILTLWRKGHEKGQYHSRVVTPLCTVVSTSCLRLKNIRSQVSFPFSLSLSLSVVLDLRQLCDVCVQEERVRYLGKGYLLMLRLAAGFSYPLTQSATLGGRR